MTESFKHKMQQWAPKPPQEVWEAIEARLDEQLPFAQKLYEFEATPPAAIWEKIAEQLPAKNEGAVVRKLKWTKWAAAAAVLFVVITGYYFLNPRKDLAPLTVSTGSVLPVPKQETDEVPQTQHNQTPSANNIAVVTSGTEQSVAKSTHPRHSFSRLKELAMDDERAIVSTSFIPDHVTSTSSIAFSDVVEKYMVYSDDDGNAMRVPRQLFESISCIRDEIACKKKKALLQAQLAATTLSTDFTGVLEMLSHLKENQ